MVSRDAIQIRVEGVEAARTALERVIRSTRGAIPEGLEMIGQQWVTEVRRDAPLDTGRLRRSYTHAVGTGNGGTYVEVSSNVHYAPYQEFGTRNIVGRPHVRPATERVRRLVPSLLVEGISRARGGMSIPSARSGPSSLGDMGGRLGALGG